MNNQGSSSFPPQFPNASSSSSHHHQLITGARPSHQNPLMIRNHPRMSPYPSPNPNNLNLMSIQHTHTLDTSAMNPPNPLDDDDLDDQDDVMVHQPKPRGRPKGSKNKPKTREPIVAPPPPPPPQLEPTRKEHLLEIPQGCDIMQMVTKFTQDHNVGIMVNNGIGKVRNVTLRNYSAYGFPVTHKETYDLVSLTGINIVGAVATNKREVNERSYSYFDGSRSNYMSVVIAGPTGNLHGGVVVGKLIASTTVLIFASSFNNYEYHRLSPPDQTPTPTPPYHTRQHGGVGTGESGSGSSSASPSGAIREYIDDDPSWEPSSSSPKRVRASDI